MVTRCVCVYNIIIDSIVELSKLKYSKFVVKALLKYWYVGIIKYIQSNLCYPGALGLGGARNSDLSLSQNTV